MPRHVDLLVDLVGSHPPLFGLEAACIVKDDFRDNFQLAWAAAVPLDREEVAFRPRWWSPWRTILAAAGFAVPLIFVHIDVMTKICIDIYRPLRKIEPMGEF